MKEARSLHLEGLSVCSRSVRLDGPGHLGIVVVGPTPLDVPEPYHFDRDIQVRRARPGGALLHVYPHLGAATEAAEVALADHHDLVAEVLAGHAALG